jgi:hypothetical protein
MGRQNQLVEETVEVSPYLTQVHVMRLVKILPCRTLFTGGGAWLGVSSIRIINNSSFQHSISIVSIIYHQHSRLAASPVIVPKLALDELSRLFITEINNEVLLLSSVWFVARPSNRSGLQARRRPRKWGQRGSSRASQLEKRRGAKRSKATS